MNCTKSNERGQANSLPSWQIIVQTSSTIAVVACSVIKDRFSDQHERIHVEESFCYSKLNNEEFLPYRFPRDSWSPNQH